MTEFLTTSAYLVIREYTKHQTQQGRLITDHLSSSILPYFNNCLHFDCRKDIKTIYFDGLESMQLVSWYFHSIGIVVAQLLNKISIVSLLVSSPPSVRFDVETEPPTHIMILLCHVFPNLHIRESHNNPCNNSYTISSKSTFAIAFGNKAAVL
ncbi:hypothetical protein P9112_010718 [Eukaryota sp. TZLM1-RC]